MGKKANAASRIYRSKEILPGVYAISSSFVISWLIVGKTGAMLVDTAYGFEDLQAFVRSITLLPLTVVNTHGHLDHSGGNFFFDSPVYLHEADREVYARHNSPSLHREGEKILGLMQKIVFWRPMITRNPEEHDADRENFSSFLPIREGDRFELGGLTAEIYEIPGHTHGSIAVFFPERKLLITSDGANPATWLFLRESTDLATYARSLRKLEALDFQYILIGHGRKPFTRKDLEAWIDVAEHPDYATAKAKKENPFEPSAVPLDVWSRNDPKHKGPHIVIDKNKLS